MEIFLSLFYAFRRPQRHNPWVGGKFYLADHVYSIPVVPTQDADVVDVCAVGLGEDAALKRPFKIAILSFRPLTPAACSNASKHVLRLI